MEHNRSVTTTPVDCFRAVIQPRLYIHGLRVLHVALRVPFSVSIMKIAGENRSLSSNVEWVIRTYEEEGGAFEEVLSGPVKCASLCERNGDSSHVNRISMLRQQHIYVQVARARAFSNI